MSGVLELSDSAIKDKDKELIRIRIRSRFTIAVPRQEQVHRYYMCDICNEGDLPGNVWGGKDRTDWNARLAAARA